MTRYLLRLDDASEYMDTEKWNRMSKLLDRHGITPIFGIIPCNRDEALVKKYEYNPVFWEWVHQQIDKGWTPAMHGYEHRYVTQDGGINPVQKRSEFAGLPYEEQCRKIAAGYAILKDNEIEPDIFFAPSHTFDENTLRALKDNTPIRIISDTIAYDVYKKGDFWFLPQQSGKVRRLPFALVTFCYHPNTMEDKDFEELDGFLTQYKGDFIGFQIMIIRSQRFALMDYVVRWLYFLRRILVGYSDRTI